jgi:hypothetical protein
MTIKELKKLLEQFDENTEIRTSEFIIDEDTLNEIEVDVLITGANQVGNIVYLEGSRLDANS